MMRGRLYLVLAVVSLAAASPLDGRIQVASVKSNAVECSQDTEYPEYFQKPGNCSSFYECSNGNLVEFTCPGNLYFDPKLDVCNYPEQVDCQSFICPNDSGAAESTYFPNPEDCNSFFECSNGKPQLLKCPNGLFWDPSINVCNFPGEVECGASGGNGNHEGGEGGDGGGGNGQDEGGQGGDSGGSNGPDEGGQGGDGGGGNGQDEGGQGGGGNGQDEGGQGGDSGGSNGPDEGGQGGDGGGGNGQDEGGQGGDSGGSNGPDEGNSEGDTSEGSSEGDSGEGSGEEDSGEGSSEGDSGEGSSEGSDDSTGTDENQGNNGNNGNGNCARRPFQPGSHVRPGNMPGKTHRPGNKPANIRPAKKGKAVNIAVKTGSNRKPVFKNHANLRKQVLKVKSVNNKKYVKPGKKVNNKK